MQTPIAFDGKLLGLFARRGRTQALTDLYFCDAAALVHRSQHRRAFLSRVSTANTSVPTPESPGTQIHSSNSQETILGLRLVIEGRKGLAEADPWAFVEILGDTPTDIPTSVRLPKLRTRSFDQISRESPS